MHRYRIHYERGAERRTAEVEANSPAEAVVKFHHVKQPSDRAHCAQLRVTSVCRDDMHDSLDA